MSVPTISGIVLEVSKNSCLLMDRNMVVHRVSAPHGTQVGDELTAAPQKNLIEKALSSSVRAKVVSAASLAAMLILAFIIPVMFRVTSTVYIDINPSVSFTLNSLDRIISADFGNKDGEDLLRSIGSMAGSSIDALIPKLIDSAAPYFKDGSATIAVSVMSGDPAESERLAIIVRNGIISYCTSQGYAITCVANSITIEMVQAADKAGLSPGQYMIIQKIIEENPEIEIDDLDGIPLGDMLIMFENDDPDSSIDIDDNPIDEPVIAPVLTPSPEPKPTPEAAASNPPAQPTPDPIASTPAVTPSPAVSTARPAVTVTPVPTPKPISPSPAAPPATPEPAPKPTPTPEPDPTQIPTPEVTPAPVITPEPQPSESPSHTPVPTPTETPQPPEPTPSPQPTPAPIYTLPPYYPPTYYPPYPTPTPIVTPTPTPIPNDEETIGELVERGIIIRIGIWPIQSCDPLLIGHDIPHGAEIFGCFSIDDRYNITGTWDPPERISGLTRVESPSHLAAHTWCTITVTNQENITYTYIAIK